MIFDGYVNALPDTDPVETAEWLDSLDAIIDVHGKTRARFLLSKLLERARESQVSFPATVSTPYINTILVGVITAIAAGFFDINVLGDMTSVGTLAAFAIVCLSVIYLRLTAPQLPRGFSVPLYPVLPILGILSCAYLITTVPWNVLQFFLWYMLGGVVLYFVYGMRNSNLQHGQMQDEAPDMGEYVAPVGEQP